VRVYTKGKHTDSILGAIAARYKQVMMMIQLRRQSFNDVLLAEPTYSQRNIRLAKFLLGGRRDTRVIGFEHDDGKNNGLDVVISKANTDSLHQAQYIFLAAATYGIDTAAYKIPKSFVTPAASGVVPEVIQPLTIGLHISARKPSQRWPVSSFVTLARLIHQQQGAALKLFWSPGAEDDAQHPGDDQKAKAILAELAPSVPISPTPSANLRALIDGMAAVDLVICADGGALHVAAGLGKPIVALFGDSEVKRWHPWGVPFRTLQKPTHDVSDISPSEVIEALDSLNLALKADRGL